MKLYQLEDGTLLNIDLFCTVQPADGEFTWRISMANGRSYGLTLDDARNLMDKELLDFAFMDE